MRQNVTLYQKNCPLGFKLSIDLIKTSLARFERISLVNRHLISGISWSVCLKRTFDSVFLGCSRMLPVDSVFWIVVNIDSLSGDPRGSPWFIWLHSWIKSSYWKQMNKDFRLLQYLMKDIDSWFSEKMTSFVYIYQRIFIWNIWVISNVSIYVVIWWLIYWWLILFDVYVEWFE